MSNGVLLVLSAEDCGGCKNFKAGNGFTQLKTLAEQSNIRYEDLTQTSLSGPLHSRVPAQLRGNWMHWFPMFAVMQANEYVKNNPDAPVRVFNAIPEGKSWKMDKKNAKPMKPETIHQWAANAIAELDKMAPIQASRDIGGGMPTHQQKFDQLPRYNLTSTLM